MMMRLFIGNWLLQRLHAREQRRIYSYLTIALPCLDKKRTVLSKKLIKQERKRVKLFHKEEGIWKLNKKRIWDYKWNSMRKHRWLCCIKRKKRNKHTRSDPIRTRKLTKPERMQNKLNLRSYKLKNCFIIKITSMLQKPPWSNHW